MLILPLVTNVCFHTLLLMQIDFNLNAIFLQEFQISEAQVVAVVQRH